MHSNASCADHDTSHCLVRIWSTWEGHGLKSRSVRGCCGCVRRPEKRKVDSSILSLTTSTGYARKALTSGNVILGPLGG